MQRFRERIDAIDEQILDLLNQRAQVVLELSEEKRRLGVPVVNKDREAEVLERLTAQNCGPLPEHSLVQIYRALMNEMRKLQRGSG